MKKRIMGLNTIDDGMMVVEWSGGGWDVKLLNDQIMIIAHQKSV